MNTLSKGRVIYVPIYATARWTCRSGPRLHTVLMTGITAVDAHRRLRRDWRRSMRVVGRR